MERDRCSTLLPSGHDAVAIFALSMSMKWMDVCRPESRSESGGQSRGLPSRFVLTMVYSSRAVLRRTWPVLIVDGDECSV